jgi:alkylhydroperoxidase family enzyme
MNPPLFLPSVDRALPSSPERREMLAKIAAAGLPVPGIYRLFAFKEERTAHLGRFVQGVLRGPSPLAAGFRELIAAFTSRRNHCPY